MGSRNLKAHGYDVTLLIDMCRAIIKAHADGRLLSSQENIAKQANLIVGASAKQRLYNITPPIRGKNWKEMHLTIDHVYHPLAKSNGKLLELLRSAKTSKGDRNKKLFQFLNEIGARALRMQLGRILEMAESSPDKYAYELMLRAGEAASL